MNVPEGMTFSEAFASLYNKYNLTANDTEITTHEQAMRTFFSECISNECKFGVGRDKINVNFYYFPYIKTELEDSANKRFLDRALVENPTKFENSPSKKYDWNEMCTYFTKEVKDKLTYQQQDQLKNCELLKSNYERIQNKKFNFFQKFKKCTVKYDVLLFNDSTINKKTETDVPCKYAISAFEEMSRIAPEYYIKNFEICVKAFSFKFCKIIQGSFKTSDLTEVLSKSLKKKENNDD